MNQYINRETGTIENEKVAGGKYIEWMYNTPSGLNLLEWIIKKKWLSKLYGWYCDSKWSKKNIKPFIEEFQIDMEQYEEDSDHFLNFNDFFVRTVKSDARPIDMAEKSLISPADGKVLVYPNIQKEAVIQVKGLSYTLEELLQDKKLAAQYDGGTLLILRLAPVDYHRFHFIDDGVCAPPKKIKGHYYSVNPAALQKIPKLFCQNKREVSLFHSAHCGQIAYIEVGATFVGSIVQTYMPSIPIKKGQEKGFFKFGGSTVILLFEKDKVVLDEDLVENTKRGLETTLRMGEKIGRIVMSDKE